MMDSVRTLVAFENRLLDEGIKTLGGGCHGLYGIALEQYDGDPGGGDVVRRTVLVVDGRPRYEVRVVRARGPQGEFAIRVFSEWLQDDDG